MTREEWIDKMTQDVMDQIKARKPTRKLVKTKTRGRVYDFRLGDPEANVIRVPTGPEWPREYNVAEIEDFR